MGLITSRAHEWAQSIPLGDQKLVCIRCNAKTVIGDWSVPRCLPHTEKADSGFKDES